MQIMHKDSVKSRRGKGLLLIILALLLVSCLDQTETVNAQEALDITWRTLKPYSSSKDRDKWEISELRKVAGRDVVSEFAEINFAYCPGPAPKENQAIKPTGRYWYIVVQPHPATPMPPVGETSPTAPPNIPEPFVREASFLIDMFDGTLIAVKMNCVVY
jgi:hypothetical protein